MLNRSRRVSQLSRTPPLPLVAGIVLSLCCARAGSSQTPLLLDPSCTVTVGNQTAAVGVDGKFIVDNIAVFQVVATGQTFAGLYRVRATCLRGGQMISGKSDFFEARPGQTSFVTQVFPTTVDPIPTFISATTEAPALGPGESAQLQVTAFYANDSSRDISARSEGTTYLSTNPDLVTVSPEGVITNVNGTHDLQFGLVAALNEGNTTLVTVQLFADSNDFDGDGIPNDIEDLFGLDKFSNDAGLDLDNDGLTNLREFQIGTLINNPDTDADGIIDGLDADPLRPEMDPPTVALTSPTDGATVVPGQTVVLAADATDDGQILGVDFLVNGALVGQATAAPYRAALTIPYGALPLSVVARARDGAGHQTTSAAASLAPASEPFTTVSGRVVDPSGTPVEGASVTLNLHGLAGAFYDFTAPLSSIPVLSGTPDARRLVSSLHFRNPGEQLSPDTFGLGFTPDFAARFSGLIEIPEAGLYLVVLGADDGAHLSLEQPGEPGGGGGGSDLRVRKRKSTQGGGAIEVDVPPTGAYHEIAQTFFLASGVYPVQVDYFQAVGGSELRFDILSNSGGGGVPGLTSRSRGVRAGRKALEAGEIVLRQAASPFSASSGDDGRFSIPTVPTALGPIGADAVLGSGDQQRTGSAPEAEPVPAGTTDFGDLALGPTNLGCVTAVVVEDPRCGAVPTLSASAPVTVPVGLYTFNGQGQPVLVQSITPDPTGRFCIDVRRSQRYFLRREDYDCGGVTRLCETSELFLSSPTLEGVCSEGGATCEDLGEVPLFCFFSGS